MELKSLPQLGHLPLEVFGVVDSSQVISTLQTGHLSLLSSISVIKYRIIESYS